jgi:hypothetical protein
MPLLDCSRLASSLDPRLPASCRCCIDRSNCYPSIFMLLTSSCFFENALPQSSPCRKLANVWLPEYLAETTVALLPRLRPAAVSLEKSARASSYPRILSPPPTPTYANPLLSHVQRTQQIQNVLCRRRSKWPESFPVLISLPFLHLSSSQVMILLIAIASHHITTSVWKNWRWLWLDIVCYSSTPTVCVIAKPTYVIVFWRRLIEINLLNFLGIMCHYYEVKPERLQH